MYILMLGSVRKMLDRIFLAFLGLDSDSTQPGKIFGFWLIDVQGCIDWDVATVGINFLRLKITLWESTN